ncbi:MAG: hypothetical protein QXX68_01775 [Candidatus Pacearchaeota archaeon]
MIRQKPIPMGQGQLVYCATPSKILHKKEKIMEFVSKKGYAPFHPFQAFPIEYFENKKNIERKKTIEYCLRAIKICDEFWLFGLSEGTLVELNFAKKLKKPIKIIRLFEDD